MYYPHFGLKEPPFKITPNTDFFFTGGNRGAVLDALVYAIVNGEGIIKVVGEVGSGKTMLCRMLQTILPEKVESIYLANPSVAPEDVLNAIAFELQLVLPKDADRLTVMQILQAHLLKRHAEGRQVVIFVEEAQGMPLATLEEIRLLSNLETKQDKLLQIVLFGQPELDVNLNETHIRQLRERITHSFHLGPLQTKDIGEYLIFRLRAAGYHGPHLFTDAAIKKLSSAAEGLVRRVNILADKALLSAFAENSFQVTHKHVKAAIQDSEFGVRAVSVKQYLMFAILLIGLLSASLAYLWFKPIQQTLNLAHFSIARQVDYAPALPANNKVVEVKAEAKALTKTFTQENKTGTSDVGKNTKSTVTSAESNNAPVVVTRQPSSAKTPTVDSNNLPASVAELAKKPVPEKATVATTTVSVSTKSAKETVVKKPIEKPVLKAVVVNSPTVESRLVTTKNWLFSSAQDMITLQIKALRFGEQFNDEQLKAELEVVQRQLGLDDIYIYRKKQNGEDYAVILYGTFTSRSEALAALSKLPKKIQTNRPYLRTLAEVNAEIEQ